MNQIKTFRNPILSLWQSAIHKAISTNQPQSARRMSSGHPMMTQFVAAAQARVQGEPAPATDTLGNTIEECAQLVVEIAWAEIIGDTQRVAELANELQDSECDPLWLEALAVYLEFKESGGSIPYIRYNDLSDFVIELPAKQNLVIAFIADWGTGAEDAQWLLSQVMQQNPDVLIHLGDIYYAGTQDEMQNNFLSICQATAGSVPIYTLSGNHDMYAGGAPYYWLIQQLQQPASYFCLRTQNWQFLAMDTGLHDCDPFTVATNVTYLDPEEVTWHLDKLENSGGRKTVLLSHHQLFSAVGTGVGTDSQGQNIAFNPHLQGSFADYLNSVALWLWGHEHNLVVFDPYLGLQKGRCIGSGAIPMMTAEQPYTPNPNFDLQGQSGPPVMNLQVQLNTNEDGFYYHAYALMTLNDSAATATVDYYQVDSIDNGESQLLYSEQVG